MGAVVLLIALFSGVQCARKIRYNGKKIRSNLIHTQLDHGRIQLFSLHKRYWPTHSPTLELIPNTAPESPPLSGLDALSIDHFSLLRGRSFALLTNATGMDLNLNRGIELMMEEGVKPALVFEPEHGLFGHLDQKNLNGIRVDPDTGLRILSLYSNTKKPNARHLKGIDLIVIDIENLPVRCYTYISTLTYLMEIAEENRIEVMILDRFNPYGFWEPEGPYLERRFTNFTATAPVPFLYSLTPGEYARYMAHARFHRLRLSIVQVARYARNENFSVLRRIWLNPSPNIPSFEASLVYPGVVLFEATNVSLGRGTTRPFVYSGAPWMDASLVLKELRKLNLPGVKFAEIVFTPTTSLYKGKPCRGIQIFPVSPRFDTLRTGYEYMRILHRLHPGKFQFVVTRKGYYMDRLWGGTSYREFIMSDLPYDRFKATWQRDTRGFRKLVKNFIMY